MPQRICVCKLMSLNLIDLPNELMCHLHNDAHLSDGK